jgi:hypothetical protein
MCIACFDDAFKWCRAKIIFVKNNKSVHVYLVDFGITKYVPWKHLRKLAPEFYDICEMVRIFFSTLE